MTDGNVPLEFGYTNYRGEYSIRRIVVLGVHFGATEWHPEPQWLLKGFDIERQAERDFAMKDIGIRHEAPRAKAEANDIALGLLDKIDQLNSAEWRGGDVQRRAAIQCAIRDAIEGA